MKDVLAMILAGGRGTRMQMLCEGRPKPALPIAARFRVIDFSLNNCVRSAIQDIAVALDYGRDTLRDYLCTGVGWGARYGASLRILEPRSGSYLGTADAVYQNITHLDEKSAELVLVLAADHIYQMDYRKMVAFHERKGADVTIGVIPVPIAEAHRFGIVTTDAQGRMIDFVEKSQVAKGNLASMGIYVFNREFLIERLREDAADPFSPHDFGLAVIPKILDQSQVLAYEFDGYWRDIGTIEAYYEANMELINESLCLSPDHNCPVLTRCAGFFSGEIPGNEINSVVSPGCLIRGHVEHSILSPGVEVAEHAVVRGSIIMANTTIGRYSTVDRAILDEEVRVGDFCRIGTESGPVAANRDIAVVGRGAVIPSYTEIGAGRPPSSSPGWRASSVVGSLSHRLSPGAVLSNK
ncbi:MAG: hypothetical protein A2Y60_06325 [Chloroflexi bacterium RBG_13_54_9]|nr:MAG: hypothetical protein A2Y60_06325 [Chloroflexi bacterium RBG_13_54_9]